MQTEHVYTGKHRPYLQRKTQAELTAWYDRMKQFIWERTLAWYSARVDFNGKRRVPTTTELAWHAIRREASYHARYCWKRYSNANTQQELF